MAVALVLGSGVAIAAVKFGTDRTDFLVGTKENAMCFMAGAATIP
jgi:hypothetical protein